MKREKPSTRRQFLSTGGAIAAAAVGTSAMHQGPARAEDPSGQPDKPRKQIVGGSPSPAYSRAVRYGDLVFVAGCVGVDKDGKIQDDFETQAGQTLLNLKESVERSGSTMDQVLKCTCFLKNYDDFKTFNAVYLKFFPSSPPARSTVVVKDFVVPGAKLEVDCVCGR